MSKRLSKEERKALKKQAKAAPRAPIAPYEINSDSYGVKWNFVDTMNILLSIDDGETRLEIREMRVLFNKALKDVVYTPVSLESVRPKR